MDGSRRDSAALLTAVTAYLTRDIAPVPLLWVIPLALYLVTWIIAFSPRARGVAGWAGRVQDLCAVGGVVLLLNPPGTLLGAGLGLVTLTVVGLVQHGALAGTAPPEEHLGRFYVALAIGGAAGTALAVGIGPSLLPIPVEAPLVLAAAVALGRPPTSRWTPRGSALFLVFGTLAVLVPLVSGVTRAHVIGALGIAAGVAAMVWRSRPYRVGLVLFLLVGVDSVLRLTGPDYLGGSYNVLGHFAVKRSRDGTALRSGSTSHGFEPAMVSGDRPDPGLYYVREGAYGDVVRLMQPRGSDWRFGVVGLGVGSLACTAPAGTRLTFFEINPGVVHLARDTALFHSLTRCAPEAEVRIGDARLTLVVESGQFELLTLDAFNSDAIPIHLLTREAFALYRSKVVPDGVIAFHLSNRFLDLVPVVGALARESGWAAVQTRAAFPRDSMPKLTNRGRWITMVTMAADRTVLEPLVRSGRWEWITERGVAAWTDDWTPLAASVRLDRENILGR